MDYMSGMRRSYDALHLWYEYVVDNRMCYESDMIQLYTIG